MSEPMRCVGVKRGVTTPFAGPGLKESKMSSESVAHCRPCMMSSSPWL